MYYIEDIRVLYENRAVESTQHFYDRLKERLIKFADIRHAIMNGVIIEQVLDDYPNPSVLIFGYDRNDDPLHIAVGVCDDKILLITAYCPSLDKWEDDYKTRRGE